MRIGTKVTAILFSLLALPVIADCDEASRAECQQQYQECARSARSQSDIQDCRNNYSVCLRAACSGQGTGRRG